MQFGKTALVGVGLLGGSLGLALRGRRLASEVAGYARRPATLEECRRMGVTDSASGDLAAVVRDAELVVLCTPVGEMRAVAERFLPLLRPDAVVTDVGSVKGSVVADLERMVADAGAQFVGSHPMAGSEKSGVGAARADLFEGAVCVVTPTPRTHPDALGRVRALWEAVGAEVLSLAPGVHDELVSRSSHLPHVVAAGLANYVLSPAHPPAQARLCATGFRDTTRVASGSPVMWRDIALANREALARVLGVFIDDLREFQQSLADADARAVEEYFVRARERRERWASGAGPGTSPRE